MDRRSAIAGLVLIACDTPPRAGVSAAGPPPIVLVSIDTFRADRVDAIPPLAQAEGTGGAAGAAPRTLTPNLDAFAAEGITFDRAFSQAVQTHPSHASLFTSRYPNEQIGVDGVTHIPTDMPVLAEILGFYGYETAAFVAGGDLAKARGLDRGFSTYEQSVDFGSLFHTGPMAAQWIESRGADAPWFLFVHGYDTHSRYLKPPPFGYAWSDARTTGVGQSAVRTATERIVDGLVLPDFTGLMQSFDRELRPRSPDARARLAATAYEPGEARVEVNDDDVELIRRVYDGAASYADAMFGLFMADLARAGVLDRAWIVVVGDHGEQLGERGLFGHCCDAGDEETHVPLLVRPPGGTGGARHVGAFVELIDVMPTVLAVAGAAAPAGIHGRSLLPMVEGAEGEPRSWTFSQGSEIMRMVTMRGARGRLSYSGLSASEPLLPDLVEAARIDGPGFSADPSLSTDDRAAMRSAMVAWLRSTTIAGAGAGKGEELPESLRKSLREHGYFNVAP